MQLAKVPSYDTEWQSREVLGIGVVKRNPDDQPGFVRDSQHNPQHGDPLKKRFRGSRSLSAKRLSSSHAGRAPSLKSRTRTY
jgi:hypothetical protein